MTQARADHVEVDPAASARAPQSSTNQSELAPAPVEPGFGDADPARLLYLQRVHGNAYVQRYVSRLTDPGAALKSDPSVGSTSDSVADRIEAARPGGAALDPAVQQHLEAGLGADLSGVRVHTDPAAASLASELGARAFTTGQDMFFGEGTFSPGTPDGLRLIAHEAVHTVQQASGAPIDGVAAAGLTVSQPGDASEQAAETAAHQLGQAEPPGSPVVSNAGTAESPAPTIQRQADNTNGPRHALAIQRQADDTNGSSPAPSDPASTSNASATTSDGEVLPRSAPAAPPAPVSAPAPSAPPAVLPAQVPSEAIAPLAPPTLPTPRLDASAAAPPPTPGGATDLSAVTAAADQARSALSGLVPTGSPVAATSPGAQVIVDALHAAGQESSLHLVDAATQSIQSIVDATSQQAAAIDQAHTQQQQAVHAEVAQRQTQIQDSVAAASADVRDSATSEQTRVAAWNTQAVDEAQQVVTSRQAQLQTAGDQHAQQARDSGARAATEATSALQDAGSQATQMGGSGGGGGDADTQQAHAEVTGRLSTDLADQVQSATPQLNAQFQTHTEEAASAVQTHAADMANAVGEHLPVLASQIGQTAQGASDALGSTASTAVSTVTDHGQQAVDQLAGAEAHVTGELATQAQGLHDQLHAGSSQAIEALRTQAAQAVSDAQAKLDEQAAQVQAAEVDEAQAGELANHVRAETGQAFAQAAGQVGATGGEVVGQLAQAGSTAATALEDLPSRAGAALESATSAVTSDMASSAQQVASAMAGAVDATTAAGAEALSTTTAALDSLVATGTSGLADAASAVGANLDQQATATRGLANDATTGLKSRIDQGNQRVDEVASTQASQTEVQGSWLSSVGNWFARQWHDFVDMLKSPSFWVGLIVTAVLVPFLGPGAFVIGGLLAGAVSGIEQNIREGKKWWDPHNILVNAAIGGLAGAAMAFGVGVIAGLGLEGLAALGAVMVLSAVIGIVVNVATGQPWDKGLLANLFFAWLFHTLFGGGRKGGEAPADGTPEGGTPEAAPGRTTTKVPGLYSGIDPAQTRVGDFEFSDTVNQHGTEISVTTEVKCPGGTGDMTRSVDTSTGQLTMDMAFLDGIPRAQRWVPTTPEMVPGRGTPLEAYMTMRQMRIIEARTNNPEAFAGPREVKISTIVNTRTTVELAQAVKGGAEPDQAVLNTNSVQYASNSIIQSGGRINSAHIEGGSPRRAGSLAVSDEECARVGVAAGDTEAYLSKYGLTPNDQVLFGFSVKLEVVPAGDQPTQQPGALTPVPHHDDQNPDGGQ